MAVIKWVRKGHLPRTEWTGETNYAERIASAIDGIVSREELLSTRPGRRGGDQYLATPDSPPGV